MGKQVIRWITGKLMEDASPTKQHSSVVEFVCIFVAEKSGMWVCHSTVKFHCKGSLHTPGYITGGNPV